MRYLSHPHGGGGSADCKFARSVSDPARPPCSFLGGDKPPHGSAATLTVGSTGSRRSVPLAGDAFRPWRLATLAIDSHADGVDRDDQQWPGEFVFFTSPEADQAFGNIVMAPGTPRSQTEKMLREVERALAVTEDKLLRAKAGWSRSLSHHWAQPAVVIRMVAAVERPIFVPVLLLN